MTAWTIRWSRQAVRDLSKLDRVAAQRIVTKLEDAATDPARHFRRLRGADEHKLRVGAHTVLALLSHTENVILAQRVGHRSTVYRGT